ncbi:hypothetical protein HMP0015_2507 [Acinetobacter haemolyticus ATCC 19194]|uniref:Uncharacterized protein n=1 Tax=Acinetobacter haemolyticus ATCC 19194 TaxID=707232 RepID=D4XS15_ACIHA|nr:hypothetical protein HMP0015_2507 [Acinetobacter haemolyticus ATCC 19194]
MHFKTNLLLFSVGNSNLIHVMMNIQKQANISDTTRHSCCQQ